MTAIEKIDELRRNKNMTAKELSIKSGISEVTMSNWKRGKTIPRLSALGKVAKALEIDISILRPYF